MAWVVNVTPQPLYPHCIGGWVGPRAGLDSAENLSPFKPGIDPRTVQLSRYTD
jgi:hypothetical protein